MDCLNLTEQQVLAIPATEPERLFTGDAAVAKQEYRHLRKKWHPDTNPGINPEVMRNIVELYDKAIALIASGRWPGRSMLRIKSLDGKEFNFQYLKAEDFELGVTYIGQRHVAWFVQSDYADLVRIAQDRVQRFEFVDVAIRQEHERHLPRLKSIVECRDGYYFVVQKPEQYLRLSDVLRHFGGKIDPRHVAWIVSTMLNLNCYLGLVGIVHHHISTETYFISPSDHDGALLGGWWYAAHSGQKLVALPQRTLNVAPPNLKSSKTAKAVTAGELIRATARELLGDPVGSRLPMMKYPAALIDWARGVPMADPLAEYSHWYQEVLPASFGARRFVEMKLSAADLYR